MKVKVELNLAEIEDILTALDAWPPLQPGNVRRRIKALEHKMHDARRALEGNQNGD